MAIPNEELNQFKPGQSGNPGGRPRALITQFIRELGDGEELKITLSQRLFGRKIGLTNSGISLKI